MRNAGLEEAQAGIKIAGRNINHLRYEDYTTVMVESDRELKSLFFLSLLFNKLSKLITAFLSTSKCLLISRLQSPSAMILEPPQK